MRLLLYILSATWFLLVLTWDVSSDYRKWKRHIPINHKTGAIVRVLLLIPTLTTLFYLKCWPVSGTLEAVSGAFITAMLMFSVWWELFDGWYNKKRGFSWYFNGSKDGKDKDAWLDQILFNVGDTWEATLKLGLIATFLTLYIFV